MTREELEKVIQHFESLRIIQRESFMRKGFDVAIKALKQESVIDKIRAKIEQRQQLYKVSIYDIDTAKEEALSWVLEIIDECKAESEEKE